MSKPRFESLTKEQVNDLVAQRVLGWSVNVEFPHALWDTPTGDYRRRYSKLNLDGFNPISSLDDAWEAEQYLYENNRQTPFDYAVTLTEIVHANFNKITHPGGQFWLILHATGRQRCHALLKTIGEVQ